MVIKSNAKLKRGVDNVSVLKQLYVIAERNKTSKICAAIAAAGAHCENTVMARGTARSDLLEMLGLDNSDKVLILATADSSAVEEIMNVLKKDFRFGAGGGIAFTVPVSAVSGPASLLILSGGKYR